MTRLEKEESIIGSLSLLANRLAQFGDGILPDITFKQWFLLLLISRIQDEEKSIRRIAEFAGTTRQNTKKLLVPLAEKGYVQITRSARDARSLQVELTPKAWQYFAENAERTAVETERLFQPFAEEEIDRLAGLLGQLAQSLEEYGSRRDRDA